MMWPFAALLIKRDESLFMDVDVDTLSLLSYAILGE
jgi:hypothetical protein